MRIVDDFWTIKDTVYLTMIGSRMGILADHASRQCINQLASLRPEDFYSTERAIFGRLPSLRDLLRSQYLEAQVARQGVEDIDFKLRRFYVSDWGDFYDRDDARRYAQVRLSKSIRPLVIDEGVCPENPDRQFWGTFFDDLHSDRTCSTIFRKPAKGNAGGHRGRSS
jgi:hypothetical protein